MIYSNSKQLDLNRILLYMQGHPISTVNAIMQESEAEPLRVYPLLFELAQKKKIRILEENGWGAPLKVELLIMQ